MAFEGFSEEFFGFFEELAQNNNRVWFEENKPRYEATIVAPCLDFIAAMAPELKQISPCFEAIPKKTGGSMFRIYRDTRFSKDKAPYKTNAGIFFRHRSGKNAHAPGFYVGLQPGQVTYGCGIWKPPSHALQKIRRAIDENPAAWQKANASKAFKAVYGGLNEGNPLVRPPKGYQADHLMMEDLKKRSFTAMAQSTEQAAGKTDFVKEVSKGYNAASPLVAFLCGSLGVNF